MWVWANEPTDDMASPLAGANPDRVVSCSTNALFHARFGLALTAPTEYVAVFDDDAVPVCWFANCLETMRRDAGDSGHAGVRLRGKGSPRPERPRLGGSPGSEAVEWTWSGTLGSCEPSGAPPSLFRPARAGTVNGGEDIELAAPRPRLSRVRCHRPPHPPGDRNLWGSLRGEELGVMREPASRRKEPTWTERDRVVQAEIEAGWRPLFLREPHIAATVLPDLAVPGPGGDGPRDATVPDILDLVPASAASVLVLGRGAPRQAAALGGMPAPTGLRAGPGRRGGTSRGAGTPITFGSATPTGSCRESRSDSVASSATASTSARRGGVAGPSPGGGLIRAGDSWSPGLPTWRHHGVIDALLDGEWPAGPPRPSDPTRSYFSCAAKSRSSVTEPAS